MAIQITKIDDRSDGFTVEFTVSTQYRRTFPVRPPGADQMIYAREQVQTIVPAPVEKPAGVIVAVPAQPVAAPEPVVELQPEPEPLPEPID